jgi:hypothetical protein
MQGVLSTALYLYSGDICGRHAIILQITDKPRAVLSDGPYKTNSSACAGDRRSLIGPLPAGATFELGGRDGLSRTNDVPN